MIFLFTDGIIEVSDSGGTEYGKERIERFMRGHHELSVSEFNQKLLNDISAYKKGDFKDDISMLSIRIK